MSETWIFALKIIGIVVVSYLLGNLNFAEIFTKARNIDIHKEGSGNPGTMNVLRVCGFKVAAATLACDVLKGAIPAIAGYFVLQVGPVFGTEIFTDPSPFLGYYVSGVGKLGMIIAGVSAVVGHIVPVLNKFRGGKGVATALGVFIAMSPFVAVGSFLLGILYLTVGKYGCVSSFVCILTNMISEITLACVYGDNIAVVVLVAALAVLIVAVHWPNLISLAKGTERDSNFIRKLKAKKAAKLACAANGADHPEANGGTEKNTPDETPAGGADAVGEKNAPETVADDASAEAADAVKTDADRS